MNIESERKQIIEKIMSVNEEWVLKAIKKLLDLDDEEISDEHKAILDELIAAHEAEPDNLLDWETVKKGLLKK